MTSELERLVRKVQAEARIPSLSVALSRADRPLWTLQVGDTTGDAFRIGSITKTFTAVLVMQARDAGLLDLDDPIGKHVDVPAHGELTLRRLLSHTGGLQREPSGDVWESLAMPDAEALLMDLAQAEAVLAPSRRFHYSNLGFAVLGQAVAKVLGGGWWPLVRERICEPLGLRSTTYDRPATAATGYLVDAYSDHVEPEHDTDLRSLAPAGQLWSTAQDMANWAAFLAGSGDGVLSPETIDEMRWPLTPRNGTVWSQGVGLGLLLLPQEGGALHVGHTGGMPGFLSSVWGRHGGVDNPGGVSAAVLSSTSTGQEINTLPHELINLALERDPMAIKPWQPGEPAPQSLHSALGRWWSEGSEFVFRWSGGRLTATSADEPPGQTPAVFAPDSAQPDILRTVSGREAGELLRLTRDENGQVVLMHWATYRFTRHQETFGRVKL